MSHFPDPVIQGGSYLSHTQPYVLELLQNYFVEVDRCMYILDLGYSFTMPDHVFIYIYIYVSIRSLRLMVVAEAT